jgi:PAS domain S-box-containing protein
MEDTKLVSAFRIASLTLSSAIIFVGGVALAAWVLHVPLAQPGLPMPTPDASLVLLLLGIALRSVVLSGSSKGFKSEPTLYAGAAALISIAALVTDLLNYRGPASLATGPNTIFMSSYVAAEFLLLSVAVLLLQQAKTRPLHILAQVLLVLALLEAFFACVSALFTAVPLTGTSPYTPIPLETAVPQLALAIAVILAQPRELLGGLLASDLPGGRIVRLWVIPAIAIVIGASLLLIVGQLFNVYGNTVSTAALAVFFLGLLLAVTFVLCKKLDTERTSQELAEHSFEKLHQERALTLAGVFEAAIYADHAGRITDWNPQAEKMLGWTQEEAVGQLVTELIIPPTLARYYQDALEECTGPGSHPIFNKLIEIDLMHRDGHQVPTELSISPIPIEDTVNFWLMPRDISERKQMGAELSRAHDQAMESSRLKSEFVANISHEIRTPLNAIIGMSEILSRRKLPEETHDLTATIHESADVLLNIVNDILDYSKIEAGKLTIEATEVDVVSLVEGAVELVAARAREKGLSLASYIGPEVPRIVRGDPGRIRQVLLNLLTNAIKFTEAGEVVVSASLKRMDDSIAYVEFFVRDTGIGMDEQALRNLFQPFTQADGSVTRKHGGTGLGLTISKRMVELMHGKMQVQSIPGEGSTFWFELPLEKPAKRALLSPARKTFQDVRLLIVDGPTNASEILEAYAASWGIRCERSDSGEEALQLMRREAAAGSPYDLAIVDFQLTYSDALALAHSIAKFSDLSSTKLLLVSSFDDVRLAQDALKSGFAAILTKPVRQSRLYDCIVNLLTQGHEAAEHLFAKSEAEAAPVKGGEPAQAETGGAPLILVVEDNPVNQKVAMLQLGELGYRAHAAGNGKEAIEALARTDYALVLMDCQMPDMDGFAATRLIREEEALSGKHVPIVALTAHAMPEDKYKCLEAGMDEYISKPVNPKTLAAVLERYLGTPIAPPSGGAEPQPKVAPARATKPPIDMASLRETFGSAAADDLVKDYVRITKSLMEQMEQAISDREAFKLEQAAHQLIGASSSLTALEMSRISRQLEKATVDRQWKSVDKIYRQLSTSFEKLNQFVSTV